jgi:hypothetical protein
MNHAKKKPRSSQAPRQAATRKQTDWSPSGQGGQPRAKTGRITQTNSTSDHKRVNLLWFLMVFDLRIDETRPNGMYFKSSYGRWAPLNISVVTEAMALSSESTHLAPPLLKCYSKMLTLPVEFCKTARSSFLLVLI